MKNYNTFTLPNGLRIIHLHSSSPVVYCGYEINAGTRDEQQGEEGLAHFCEHTSFKGTQRRKAWQISNYLEKVGGELNAFTNKEETAYYAAIMGEDFPRAVDLLTDIVFNATYPQHELTKESEVICEEMESYNDSPEELIYDEFENAIYENHPLGHSILGSSKQVRRFNTEDALRFVTKYYRPENAVFFVYGNLETRKIEDILLKASAKMRTGGKIEQDMGQNRDSVYQPREIVFHKNTHQTHVMIGNRAYDYNDKKRFPLLILNNLLGGPSMNSRFNTSLREHRGLVYTVESNMTAYKDTGNWSVYFGCAPGDVKRCRQLIYKELKRVREQLLTEFQLNAAKKQLKGQIGVSSDNREYFALDFAKGFLHQAAERDIRELFRRIDAVTAEQIMEVANEVMGEDQLTTVLFA